MDGIAGIVVGRSAAAHTALGRMKRQLAAARADGAVTWDDADAGVLLGYNRLAGGARAGPAMQPLRSASGRWIVALSGRIHNHREIGSELQAAGWPLPAPPAADAAALAGALDASGFDAALARIDGAFALAAWDRDQRCLWLARDPMGAKSLYYGWLDGALVFASELRPISRFDHGRKLSISPDSLALLTALNYIPAPHSIYREISRLGPGCRLRLPVPGDAAETHRYWTFPAPRADWTDPEFPLAAQVAAVDAALAAAVERQIDFDAPAGALLSGGIDSSLVTALMQARSAAPVKTFTIGFEDAEADESGHARAVARHLGTEHHELLVTSRMALDQIPRLPALLDEPFGDSSQIPTLCVLGFAREQVAVAFGGDGADELFGGYGRYRRLPGTWGVARWFPLPLRRAAATLVESGLGDLAAGLLGQRGAAALHKARYYLPRIAHAASAQDLYLAMLMQWARAGVVRDTTRSDLDAVRHALGAAGSRALVPFMMETDVLSYLPDDCAVKVDRAATSHGLETRSPFLERGVVELSTRIPLGGKLGRDGGKVVLRECLARRVPRQLFERPKHGFSVPLDAWLRGPLRDWAEALLDARRLAAEAHFDVGVVRAAWNDHLAGRASNGHQLWSVLVFQAWLDGMRGHSDHG